MKTIILIAALTATITSSQAATGDDNGSTVLSVSLSNFKGVISETLEVDLSWATMMQSNMEFFDLMGKKISETVLENLNGRQNVQISKSGVLPTGTYIARLTSNSQDIKTQLLIVQNR